MQYFSRLAETEQKLQKPPEGPDGLPQGKRTELLLDQEAIRNWRVSQRLKFVPGATFWVIKALCCCLLFKRQKMQVGKKPVYQIHVCFNALRQCSSALINLSRLKHCGPSLYEGLARLEHLRLLKDPQQPHWPLLMDHLSPASLDKQDTM